jgi:hypothetical protein
MSLTETMVAPTVTHPASISAAGALDLVVFTFWKEEFSDYNKRSTIIQQNMKVVLAVLWGQCSESLKDKLKSINEYKTKLTKRDCVWLLAKIKAIMLQFKRQRSLFLSLSDANRNLFVFYQSDMISTVFDLRTVLTSQHVLLCPRHITKYWHKKDGMPPHTYN